MCSPISLLSLVLLSAKVIMDANTPVANCSQFSKSKTGLKKMATWPKVVIVGGGISGLAAASRLSNSGFENVKILEASNRCGGRIRSSLELKDHGYIEMGAQWIHGEIANVAYKIANAKGWVVNSKDEEDFNETLVFEGEGYVSEKFKNELEQVVEKVTEEAEEYQDYTPELSYGAFFGEKYSELTRHLSSSNVAPYLTAFKDLHHRFTNSLDGSINWNDLSFKGTMHDYHECDGNQMVSFKQSNGENHKYEDLVQYFKNDIPYSNILLNSPVNKVDYSNESIVKIHTENGDIHEADVVIFTGSLGFLKEHAEDLFVPKLPEDKMEAIDLIGFGSIDKIFLEFPRKIFDHDGIRFLFKDEGISYTAQDAAKDWTRFILGAYVEENKPRIISLWLSNEGAKHMETLDDDQVKKDVMKLIRRFLPNESIPDPTRILRSNWYQNPFTRGSYSYQTTNSSIAKLGPATLAEPVGNGRVLFAGEATHDKYFSTVHGAIESGWREADRIICSLTET